MLTLQILAGWTIVIGILSVICFFEGERKFAGWFFLNVGLAPTSFILMLILIIGLAPSNY